MLTHLQEILATLHHVVGSRLDVRDLKQNLAVHNDGNTVIQQRAVSFNISVILMELSLLVDLSFSRKLPLLLEASFSWSCLLQQKCHSHGAVSFSRSVILISHGAVSFSRSVLPMKQSLLVQQLYSSAGSCLFYYKCHSHGAVSFIISVLFMQLSL